ncbi:hypothetical protein ACPZ19_38590 [Amycolatopsis lurida]
MVDTATMTTAEANEIRECNLGLIEKYLGREGIAWWDRGAEEAGWFAEDFLYQLPWAPRGMPVTYAGNDRREYFKLLNSWLKDYEVKWQKISPLIDPYAFWVEYYAQGESAWGKGGPYEQYEIVFMRLDEQGRLTRCVEYFNPVNWWVAAGKTEPRFDYNIDRLRNGLEPDIRPEEDYSLRHYIEWRKNQDAIDEAMAADLKGMSAQEISEIRERNRKLLTKYLSAEAEGMPWWDERRTPGADYHSENHFTETPISAPGMPLKHGPGHWQKDNEWLARTVMSFDVSVECFYDMDDPYTFWYEYCGEGNMTWGQGGSYSVWEVVFVRLDKDGRMSRHRESYDPSRLLETAGSWKLPVCNMNEERKRHGLAPHGQRIDVMEDYVQQRIADAARGVQL